MPLRPITEVATDLGLQPAELMSFGPHMAKLTWPALRRLEGAGPRGTIVLVSAINPTRFGEGKTTVSIGLDQALRGLGRRAVVALREPSLGPVFGIKGGGTGGGRCQLEPAARINLHFTGDLHAVAAAHNLLAAVADNALHFGDEVGLDPRRIAWRRVLDANDRSLRHVVTGLGGEGQGMPRESAFDITAASEVMAVLCLARDLPDLKARLARIHVGFDQKGQAVTAGRLRTAGAMAALLHDAILPNLVQTTDGTPAFVHGGPFGNIAHGCSSVIATRAAVACAELVVTEAGFGFDLGAEKFFDIKCRALGAWPSAVVLVLSARALRFHGGDRDPKPGAAGALAAIEQGFANFEQHVASARAFGFDPVVAINRFPQDTEAEIRAIEAGCAARGLRHAPFRGHAEGGPGAVELAREVLQASAPHAPRFLYDLQAPPEEKIATVARVIYGAREVAFTREARRDLDLLARLGHAALPVCIAKTHLSLSDDERQEGRPRDFTLTVRSVRVAAGAGYLLALTGDIVTMPGLPRTPAAQAIDLDEDGHVRGIV